LPFVHLIDNKENMRGIYQGLHPLSKIGVVAIVALCSLFLFMIISAVLAIPVFGTEAFRQIVSSAMEFDESNIEVLKYFQLAQSIGLFIFPSIVLALLFGKNVLQYLKLRGMPNYVNLILVIAIVLFSSPAINLVGEWNANMQLPDWLEGIESWMKTTEDSAARLTELFVSASTLKGLLFNIFLIGVIPAIGEEFLFRGVVQRIIAEWTKNKHLAVWISAIAFSALHMQFYGFIPRALLGAMFGYMFIWSGNLWLPVLAHFVNNTAAVIAYYYYQNGLMDIDPDSLGTKGASGLITAFFSVVLVALLFFIFYKRQRKLTIAQSGGD
jgi:membrane protease YdiL (CAAX protease family)